MSDSDARSFFVRERERLVQDITNNLETVISSTNAVNRKLEEHISVGKGFESISALWGQFSELVTQAGMQPAPPEVEEQAERDVYVSPH